MASGRKGRETGSPGDELSDAVTRPLADGDPVGDGNVMDADLLASVSVPMLRSDGTDIVIEDAASDALNRLEQELASVRLANEVLEDRLGNIGSSLASSGAAEGYEINHLRALVITLESERDQAFEVADELRTRVSSLEERSRGGSDDDYGSDLLPEEGDAERPSPIATRVAELESSIRGLQTMVRTSSTQIQHYLLELEAAQGGVVRTRQEAEKYSRSVNDLFEAINHLGQYVSDEETGDPQAKPLVVEVRRCAGDLRALVESNERFGKSIESMIARLGGILSKG